MVRHPIGTVNLDEVRKQADAAIDRLVEILVEPQRNANVA